MSCQDPGLDDLAYPVCEQVRDLLISKEQTPRSRHLPRGPTPYYPYSDIIRLLGEKSHADSKGREISRGESVFNCKCLRCQKQAGLQGGINNRSSRWDDGELLGSFATIYALLIFLRCPGLISIFRQNGFSLDSGYLSYEQLLFIDRSEGLTATQANNIRNEILRTQYQFRVRKFAKRTEITIVDERETLPIREDQIVAGEGNFGEVYAFDIPSEYIDENLRSLQTSRFARKIFKQLPTQSKQHVKEVVLQQLSNKEKPHSHLMPALAAFEHGKDFFFILFELAESTLYKFLAGDGPDISPRELWKQVLGLSDGLARLHRMGVVHRDLKPANVLIVKGVMKIADFGFASYNPSLDTTGSSLTGSYVPEGISNYSPPPSDGGCEKYDVYSLGAMMSEIACFDVGKESRVAQYRQRRSEDPGEKHNHSRRFYYQEGNEMKSSVAEQHLSLLKWVQEESKNPETTMVPWQEFFLQEDLFSMIEDMLQGSKASRPKAAEVAFRLGKFSTRAEEDIAHQAQNINDRTEYRAVNKWLELFVDNALGPSELGNRFIASFAGNMSCGLLLYPNARTEKIKILRVEYSFNESGVKPEKEREISVDRKQKVPEAGIKPAYFEEANGNAVCLVNDEVKTIYTFRRLSDALRFQGVMTGEFVYNHMSFKLNDFSLRNYGKSTSTPSIPFLSRSKKSKDKKQVVRGEAAQLQMWNRKMHDSSALPDVKIAILSKDTLTIVKITSQFVENAANRLTRLDPPPPSTIARLSLPETQSIDISEGIPFILEPRKYDNYDEVRLDFKDENDCKAFWQDLDALVKKSFPVKSSRKVDSPKGSILSRRDTTESDETTRSRETTHSRKATGNGRELVEPRRDSRRYNTLPANHS